MSLISLCIPCFNESENIPLFVQEIEKIALKLSDVTFELVFVDDGSKDTTRKVLREFAAKYSFIKYISFSRNFGKEAAILAGLRATKGDYIAVIDADLQHPPHLLISMYEALQNKDYDCAAMRRVNRQGEPIVRSFFARRFYKIINKISDITFVEGATDYRLMTRTMVNAILSLPEYNRFSKGIFSWVGFETVWIEAENVQRIHGTSKWSFWSLVSYSFDGIIGFSSKPLMIASVMGFLFYVLAILGTVFVIIRWILFGDPVAGWASTICIVLFAGGTQLLATGILGQYLAKTYLETKHRPIYIIKEESTDY